MDSKQSLSNYQQHFSQNKNKKFTVCMETQKTPSGQSNLEILRKKKTELEERGFWTPEYTTKPHQYNNSTSTATETQIHGTGYKAQRYTATATQSMTKEARTYSRERTVSSITGAGKTEQLHVKE